MRSFVQVMGQQELIVRLNLVSNAIERTTAREILRFSLKVQRRVKEKLSGEVLKVKTGNLRASIHAEVEQSREKISGRVGTNVVYAKTHEYGLSVRGHKYPERSFLRSALNELSPDLISELESEIMKDVRKVMRG